MTPACFKAYDICGKLDDSPAVFQHVRTIETLIRDAG